MLNSFARQAVVAISALQVSVAAAAATPGTLGSTSTGTVNISATVPGRVQISGLSDIAFGTLDPAGPASNVQDVCVWSNTNGRAYSITATGSGLGGGFAITDGTNELDYGVQWATTPGQSSGSALMPAGALTGLSSAAVDPMCSAGVGASASLIVSMTAAELQAAVAGSYTGTLTLVVAPQ